MGLFSKPSNIGTAGSPATPQEQAYLDKQDSGRNPAAEHAENASMFRAEVTPPRKMADGGVVKATPGGTDVTVAEAGQDEAIVPLPDDAEEVPEVDPRDGQITDLEAQLAEANTRCEVLGQALFAARVSATDLLGDPASMPYSPDLVDADDDALTAAVLALIGSDPSLGKLAVRGDIDQGSSDPPATPGVSLLNILKDAL